mmetsp:Transcript_29728/g.95879  ORF Transcript_29728/g.95879 Transcript_29728/m.95879 type:complete len:224 (+) Transcript_29728:366-1037(+)
MRSSLYISSMASQTFSKSARPSLVFAPATSVQASMISSSLRSSGSSPRRAAMGGRFLKARRSTSPVGGLAQYSAVANMASMSFGSLAVFSTPSAAAATSTTAGAMEAASSACLYMVSSSSGLMDSICFWAISLAVAICSGDMVSICFFIMFRAAGFDLSKFSDTFSMSGFVPIFFISSFWSGVRFSICASIISIWLLSKFFIASAAIFICSGVNGPSGPCGVE